MMLVPPPPPAAAEPAPVPAPAPRERARRATAGRARLRRGRRVFLVGADALALAVALAVAVAVAHVLGRPMPDLRAGAAAALAGAAIAGWLAVFAACRLYAGGTRTIAPAGAAEAGALFHALLAGSLPGLLAAKGAESVVDTVVWTPLEAVLFIAAAVLAVPAARAVTRSLVLPYAVRPRRALVVGAGARGRWLAAALADHPEWGLELVGFADDDLVRRASGPVLGRIADVARIVQEHRVEWVLVAFSRRSPAAVLEAVAATCPRAHLAVVPGPVERVAAAGTVEDLDGIPVVTLPRMEARADADAPIPLRPARSRSVRGEVRTFLRAAAGRRRSHGTP